MRKILACMLMGWLAAVCLMAQPSETPKLIAVRAARMLDVKTGVFVRDAVVVIEGERIISAGSGLSVP